MRADKNRMMIKLMGNSKYKGKHLILVAGKIFTARTGLQANKVLDRIEKKYPKETPVITYNPKADTLVL